MAQTIKLKRSASAGAVPGTSDLELGEIALNTRDGAVYIKKNDGSSDSIVAVHDNDILHIDTTNSRVGIGETNPQALLHVTKATGGTTGTVIAAGTDAGILLQDSSSPSANYFVSKIHNPGNGNAIGGIKFAVSPDSVNYSWAGMKAFTSASGDADILAFYTSASNTSGDASTERMRIDQSGSVGIGTNSPSAQLHVKSSGNGEIEVERTSGALINLQAQSAAGYIGTDSNHLFGLKANGTVRLKIATSGAITFNDAYSFPTSDGSADQILKTDGSGTLTFADESGGAASGQIETSTMDGDGSDATLTLTSAPTSEDNLIVFIDGVYQNKDSYTISSTTLTFDTAPDNGTKVTAHHIKTGIVGSVPTINTMTGDGSDTTLTLGTAPVSENATFVTIDGVVQHKSTYSVSGTTLTFSTAPPTGTAVECITFVNTTTTDLKSIQDADSDTKIQIEESSDEDKIRFDTAGTERMIIDNAGNVGVGTSSPAERLHVVGDVRVDTDLYIQPTNKFYLDGGNDTYISEAAANQMVFNTGGAEKLRINSSGSLLGGITSQVGVGGTPADVNSFELGRGYLNLARDDTASAKQITFGKNGAVHSYIETTSSGLNIGGANVGIGRTSPVSKLDVYNSSGTTPAFTTFNAGNSSDITSFAAHAALQLICYQSEGNPYTKTSAIIANADGTVPSEMQFWTKTNGASSAAERMRIDSSGNLGIGTTSPSKKLHISSMVFQQTSQI